MIDQDTLQKIVQRIDASRDAMIELQIALTAIPAIAPESGGTGEWEKAAYLEGVLRRFGFDEIVRIDAPDNRVPSGLRPNLVVRSHCAPGKTTVWVMSHTDVVPPGERSLWTEDPYKGYVKDGRLYGRGMEDNQKDLVASLFAAKAFRDLGIEPPNGMGLIFVSDEETASSHGISAILAHKDNPFRKSDLIVVPDSGNTEGTLIEVAEKSILWARFRTTGIQCHGSKPSLGKNAFHAASEMVVGLYDTLHERFAEEDPLYDPPMSTFEPTRKDANVPNINTIPGDDVFFYDCRILPRYPLEAVDAVMREVADRIEARFGVTVEIHPVQHVQAPEPTASDAPVVACLQEAIRDVYQVEAKPRGIGAGTVAAYLRQEGYPVAVWCKTSPTPHQPDEYCLIDNMLGDAKVFAHLFLQNLKKG